MIHSERVGGGEPSDVLEKEKARATDTPQQSSTPKPASQSSGTARPKLSLLSLESRLMFDAAAAATAAEVNQEQVAQKQAKSAVSNDNTSGSESQASIESQE